MKSKFTFIKSISILLKVIWYLQWMLALVLFISALLIITNANWKGLEKLNGFHISFARIELGDVYIQDNTEHNVTITHGEGRLYIDDYQQNIVIYRIIGAFIELIISMYIIYILSKIFRNLKTENFFVRENGLLLRKIAFAIIGISLFLSIYEYVISNYIHRNILIEHIVLKRNIELDTRTIIFGLMIFVIAKIFIKGTEIKEEQDLTI